MPWAKAGVYVTSLTVFIAAWVLLATYVFQPLFLPSPARVLEAAGSLWADGDLQEHIIVSLGRIAAGFVLGCLVGAPLGLAIGTSNTVRRVIEPQLQLFRFIPPIAVLPVALLWLGPTEPSKVFLVFYATVFTVVLGTAAGAASVPMTTLRAAASLGASRWQMFRSVVAPATVPAALSAMVVALGLSFMTIVSAEMVAARVGLGFLVQHARLVYHTDWIFVGVAVLGVLGFTADRLLRLLGNRLTARYGTRL
jgi:NitT/TauT family transport system permease protein